MLCVCDILSDGLFDILSDGLSDILSDGLTNPTKMIYSIKISSKYRSKN